MRLVSSEFLKLYRRTGIVLAPTRQVGGPNVRLRPISDIGGNLADHLIWTPPPR